MADTAKKELGLLDDAKRKAQREVDALQELHKSVVNDINISRKNLETMREEQQRAKQEILSTEAEKVKEWSKKTDTLIAREAVVKAREDAVTQAEADLAGREATMKNMHSDATGKLTLTEQKEAVMKKREEAVELKYQMAMEKERQAAAKLSQATGQPVVVPA